MYTLVFMGGDCLVLIFSSGEGIGVGVVVFYDSVWNKDFIPFRCLVEVLFVVLRSYSSNFC